MEEEQAFSDSTMQLMAHYGFTGDAMASHLRALREKALAVHDFHCIRRYAFSEARSSTHPIYATLAKRSHDRAASESWRFLDVGCW